MLVQFQGKHLGAIGVAQFFTVEVEANDLEDARLKLYDNYDHIHGLCEITETTDYLLDARHYLAQRWEYLGYRGWQGNLTKALYIKTNLPSVLKNMRDNSNYIRDQRIRYGFSD